jgi:hypothetical protein
MASLGIAGKSDGEALEYVDANISTSFKFNTDGSMEIQPDPCMPLTYNREAGRLTGWSRLSQRLELKWIAGAKGLVQLNAVTDPLGRRHLQHRGLHRAPERRPRVRALGRQRFQR